MAFGKSKAATKPEPKEEKKGDRPDFIARARQSAGSEYYSTIGAAWKRTNDKGEEFLSVKLNSTPVNFDGSFVLMPPLPDRE